MFTIALIVMTGFLAYFLSDFWYDGFTRFFQSPGSKSRFRSRNIERDTLKEIHDADVSFDVSHHNVVTRSCLSFLSSLMKKLGGFVFTCAMPFNWISEWILGNTYAKNYSARGSYSNVSSFSSNRQSMTVDAQQLTRSSSSDSNTGAWPEQASTVFSNKRGIHTSSLKNLGLETGRVAANDSNAVQIAISSDPKRLTDASPASGCTQNTLEQPSDSLGAPNNLEEPSVLSATGASKTKVKSAVSEKPKLLALGAAGEAGAASGTDKAEQSKKSGSECTNNCSDRGLNDSAKTGTPHLSNRKNGERSSISQGGSKHSNSDNKHSQDKSAKSSSTGSIIGQNVTAISEYNTKPKTRENAKKSSSAKANFQDKRKSSSKVPAKSASASKQGKNTKSATVVPAKSVFNRPKGPVDDLKEIRGIGKVMEKTLNDMGVTTFEQLASFKKADVELLNKKLDCFAGRIERDQWIPQAKEIHKRNSKLNRAA